MHVLLLIRRHNGVSSFIVTLSIAKNFFNIAKKFLRTTNRVWHAVLRAQTDA